MNRWKFLVLVVSIFASVAVYGYGICPGKLYPNPGNACRPCLGCVKCCATCTVYCQDPNNIAFVGSHSDRYTDIRFHNGLAEWNLDTTTIGGEYRPTRVTFGGSILDPSVQLGFGRGNAELTIAGTPQFDDDLTVFTGSAGLHWTHWTRWGSDFEIGYRKLLDSGTTTPATAGESTENSVDFSAIDAALSVRYGLIPDRLIASAGVRTTQGDVTLKQKAGSFLFRRSADVDRQQFIAGAEVRITRRLSANVEFGTGDGRYTAVSLRYGFGRGGTVAGAGIAAISARDLVCVWRGGQPCNGPGFKCLVLFPESEWRVVGPQFADAAFVNGTGEIVGGAQPLLRYEFTSAPSMSIPTFTLDEPVTLSASASRTLGFETVTILPGTYSIDPHIGSRGGIVYNVRMSAANPANPQDAFGQLHNEGIRYFRTEFARRPSTTALASAEFAAVFHTIMEPWVRMTARDSRYLAMAGAANADQAYSDMKRMLDQIRDDSSVRERLGRVPDATNVMYGRIDAALRRLDGGCSDLAQYRQELRGIEADVLSGTDVLGARLTSLARQGAVLYEPDASASTKKFPWRDLLGGDLSGASNGAWLGGFTGPGGAAAGGVIGGLFGSALVLYDHGYIRD